MDQLFATYRSTLASFLEQRDELALRVEADGAASAIVLKLVESIDEGGSPDLFFTWRASFVDADQYARALVDTQRARHMALQAAQRAEGLPVWPDFPPGEIVGDPCARLRTLFGIVASMRPDPRAMRAVLVLFPEHIETPAAWRDFLDALLAHEPMRPWCAGMRFLVRVDPQTPAGSRPLRTLVADCSPRALARASEDAAYDTARPLADRMRHLLTLAGLDLSHRRLAAAREKYELLYEFHSSRGETALAALALNGVGEVCAAGGEIDAARDLFLRALTPALEARAVPVVLNVVLNLGNLALRTEAWRDAETWYGLGVDVAAAARNVQTQIDCWTNLGSVRARMGRFGDASVAWRTALRLAQAIRDDERADAIGSRWTALCRHLGIAARDLDTGRPQPTTAPRDESSRRAPCHSTPHNH